MEAKSLNIKISPKGSGKVSDKSLEDLLRAKNPFVLLLSQKLLASTSKYIKKKGFFSTEASRLQKVQRLTYQLNLELKKENPTADDLARLETHLSMISDTYPNWRDEYQVLNRLIPLFF